MSLETLQPAIDMGKMEAFINKVMGDMSGAVVGLMCALGDRLGLFKALMAYGPATSVEFAAHAGVDERYAREWLSALTSARYLEYDPASQTFILPPEHAGALAEEGGMTFMGGAFQLLHGLVGTLDQLVEAFRSRRHVPQESYNENLQCGMERMSAVWFENMLVQQWISSIPDVQAQLEHGVHVADIGCGSGRALITLARAFPKSRFVGYDSFGAAISHATANAEAAGVTDRVRFEQRNVLAGLPEQYNVITTFDALHDIVDLRAGLGAIRRALLPDGRYVLLEPNCSDKLEENIGPIGALMYGTSVLYNLPVSLAHGGDGVGTLGLPESKVRQLCAEVGFKSVYRLPVMHPLHALYEARP